MKKLIALVLILMLMVSALPALATNEPIGFIQFYSTKKEAWLDAPEINDDYGRRIFFSCSTALYLGTNWSTVYSAKQWAKIETTWVKIRVLVPAGVTSRVWVEGWNQLNTTERGGYLLELDPGFYEFEVINGEVQHWETRATQSAVDFARIIQQKRDGHKNVPHELGFTGITQNLVSRIPADFTYKITNGPVPTYTIR